MAKKHLSDDKIDEIRILYKNGKTIRELSKQFDRNYTSIYYIVKNVSYRSRTYRPPQKTFPVSYLASLMNSKRDFSYEQLGILCAQKINRAKPFMPTCVWSYLKKIRDGQK